MVLRRRVCGGELGGEVCEIGECELARVGFVAYAQEADVVFDDVATSDKQKKKRNMLVAVEAVEAVEAVASHIL